MSQKIETLGLILIFLLSVLVSFGYSVSADYILDDSSVFQIDNVNYTFPATSITFTSFGYNETMIYFENTYFNVSSTNTLDVELSYLKDNILNATNKELVLQFTANTTGGTVWFNISGFAPGHSYEILRDDVSHQFVIADSSGEVSFNSTVWSEHDFKFRAAVGVLRINYDYSRVDTNEIGNTVFNILMIAMVIGAIFLIIVLMVKQGYI